MAKTITLRFPGRCADCGAALEVGAKARWYGRGRVYGLACHSRVTRESLGHEPDEHEVDALMAEARHDSLLGWDAQRGRAVRSNGMCEDAPCCGCCGPGSDDPSYQPRDYDEHEDYR